MFFVAFAVFLAGAVYISPVFCGSNAEKKMVSKPQEIESGECAILYYIAIQSDHRVQLYMYVINPSG